MRVVDLRELKKGLREYVRLAASGETVLVTDRERVVAELIPPRKGRAPAAHAAILAEAVRKGWLSPALGAVAGPPPRRPTVPLAELLAELEGDRADQ